MADRADRTRLFACGIASAIVHLGAGVAIAIAVTQSRAAGASEGIFDLASPDAEKSPPPVALGVDNSRAVTLTWLGFEAPELQQAQKADADQAAATLAPIGPDQGPEASASPPPAPPAEAAAEPAPTPAEAPAPAEAQPIQSEAPPEVEPLPVAEEAHVAALPVPSEAPPATGQSPSEAEAEPSPQQTDEAAATNATPAPAADQQAPAQPQPNTQVVPQAAQVAPEASKSGGGDLEGPVADRESEAFSAEIPLEYRSGAVIAAEGLTIHTVRPRWSHTTILTRSPRDPVLLIEFDATGKVRRAPWAKSKDGLLLCTGFEDVDEPLLNAVYKWRASGTRLAELAAKSPTGTVKVRMKFIIRQSFR